MMASRHLAASKWWVSPHDRHPLTHSIFAIRSSKGGIILEPEPCLPSPAVA